MGVPLIIMGGNVEDWGYIPSFLDTDDPRTAKEQFHAHYIGGWNKFDGFTWDDENETLSYPGDPPMKPLSTMAFRDEAILLFPYSWVLILQNDNTWEVARMD